jgi:hypothetical protein
MSDSKSAHVCPRVSFPKRCPFLPYLTTILTYTDVKRVLVIHGLLLPSARGPF